MASQIITKDPSQVLNRAILTIDHSLLSGRYANDVEAFRSDFQKVLDQAGLYSTYATKLVHQTRCKNDEALGISLGSPSSYVIEAFYVEGEMKYTWHVCLPEKDTQSFHDNIQKVLRGEQVVLPEEIKPQKKKSSAVQEGDVAEEQDGHDYDGNVIYRDPLVAAQALLTLWALTEGDKSLPTNLLTEIFMFCYKQDLPNRVSSYHSVFTRRNHIEKTEGREYRATPDGFAYIQEHQKLLSQSGKIKEIEQTFLKDLERKKSVDARLKEVRIQLATSQGPTRLTRSKSSKLRMERKRLMAQQEHLRQIDRALLRLRTNFIHA